VLRKVSDWVTYRVAVAEGLDVEKGESFVGFEELEAGDFTCCRWSMMAGFLTGGGVSWRADL